MTYKEAKKMANKNNPNILYTGDAGNGCTFEVYYNPLLGRQIWATVMPNGLRVY